MALIFYLKSTAVMYSNTVVGKVALQSANQHKEEVHAEPALKTVFALEPSSVDKKAL